MYTVISALFFLILANTMTFANDNQPCDDKPTETVQKGKLTIIKNPKFEGVKSYRIEATYYVHGADGNDWGPGYCKYFGFTKTVEFSRCLPSDDEELVQLDYSTGELKGKKSKGDYSSYSEYWRAIDSIACE